MAFVVHLPADVAFACHRHHGGGVPEYWGRDSPYHGGTEFLGTPKNHLEVREGSEAAAAWG